MSLLTIYCGIFFLAAKDAHALDFDKNCDFALNATGQLVLFGVILLANVAFAAIWIVKLYFLMRAMFRDKMPKVYACVCLCCRLDKLEKESRNFAQAQKIEEVLENIEEVQFCKCICLLSGIVFKEMKGMYKQNTRDTTSS